jgi:hypothetical protein
MSRLVRVELLRHDGCPRAAQVRELVEDCVQELGVDAVVTDRVARYPSPSLLVDGVDVMGDPGDGVPVDACRLDVPTRVRVVAALRAASSSPER